MDDVDFKAKVTRVEFEELCADLFDRVPGPVQQALQSAEMSLVRDEGDVPTGEHSTPQSVRERTLTPASHLPLLQDQIEQVILVGGATRVPKVQEVLLKAVGK